MTETFGQALRRWRRLRRRTQLDLALAAGYSQRHLSFLESGRSRPSRSAVLVLAEALDVPLRERNALLHAAGFAPGFSAEPLDSERLRPAVEALATVADAHRPFPALIVDRSWNVRGGNANAFALFERYAELSPGADGTLNALALCVDPRGLRPRIRNWASFMARLLTQFRLELAREDEPELRALVERVEADPEYRAGLRRDAGADPLRDPVATLVLEADGRELAFFTLHSNLAVAQDATLADLRVETFFPADAATRTALLELDAALPSSAGTALPVPRSARTAQPR
ncbi:MAG: helix-turn-helix transcriptional regulator [Pseudomonadales bacterium]|jgi:transcriptional regulator with XRE-family HTH domain|nr:helix-turn-helix transcriptional regulator [Pseudomonadales bacterium]